MWWNYHESDGQASQGRVWHRWPDVRVLPIAPKSAPSNTTQSDYDCGDCPCDIMAVTRKLFIRFLYIMSLTYGSKSGDSDFQRGQWSKKMQSRVYNIVSRLDDHHPLFLVLCASVKRGPDFHFSLFVESLNELNRKGGVISLIGCAGFWYYNHNKLSRLYIYNSWSPNWVWRSCLHASQLHRT